MIKLIASDMDDTLLNSRREISDRTLKAINAARERGIKFTISTGRMFDSARAYINMLNLTDPVIVYNGAMVAAPDGTVLYHRPCENAPAAEVLRLAEQLGCYSQIYVDDVLYTREEGPETEVYRRHTGNKAIALHMPLWECLDKPTTKIIMIMPADKVKERLPEMRRRFSGRLQVTVSKPEYMEFMDPAVGKGEALLRLGGIMGIRREEIMAFGDALNDITMLQAAGTGVAVANAVPEAKEAADIICASCDDDGPAQIIEGLPG